jgi:hypothetical protein
MFRQVLSTGLRVKPSMLQNVQRIALNQSRMALSTSTGDYMANVR